MKRSQINQTIEEALIFFKSMNFYLPEFAYYSIDDWKEKIDNAHEIFDLGLGWDITDFGLGDFQNTGLTLFTLRNGSLTNGKYQKPYAEKIMLVKVDQVTPYHYHWHKIEDIINRGGGDLVFKLADSTPDDEMDEDEPDNIEEACSDMINAAIDVLIENGFFI